jgi:glycosyltransferase involved in cell wall biosynthesis
MNTKASSERLLTVIVPSFNQARFIGECLREPLDLAPAGVELLVMDGGSTDGTVAILQELLGNGGCWVSESDRGQAHAINKGLSRAQGKWVAFQNSDDFYVKGKLALALEVMRSSNDYDVILGATAFVDEEGRVTHAAYPKPIFLPCLSQLNFLNNQSFFVRREFIDKVGLTDENLQFCVDYDWFIKIYRHNPNVCYIHEIVGAQRYHAATKTANMKHVHDYEWMFVSRRHFSTAERVLGMALLQPYRLFRYLYGVAHRGRRGTWESIS